MIYLLLFLAHFVFVFLKALQTRNINGDDFAWVIPISMALACTEVYVIVQIAHLGLSSQTVIAALALGLGGGLGSMAAMKFHHRFIKGRRW